jgi:Flp pilus assembly protein protease CpaA
MSHLTARLLYWSPRILAIAFAVFISIFALDVFGENHGFWPTALAFSIHMIPTMIVVAILIAAWRWEWVGAVVYALLTALYLWWGLPRRPLLGVLMIATPLLVIAGLFLADWIERAKLRLALTA